MSSTESGPAEVATVTASAKLPSPLGSRSRNRSRSVFAAPLSTVPKRPEISCAPLGTVNGYSCVPGSEPLGLSAPVVAVMRRPA